MPGQPLKRVTIYSNYSLKWRWLVRDFYLAANLVYTKTEIIEHKNDDY